MAEAWEQWHGEIIGGEYRLRQYLGGSDHSAVFLAERGGEPQPVALKFVPAIPATADAQIARWELGKKLNHTDLVRIVGAGRCQLGNSPFLYVVTERADENLSQILPQRALTARETSDMLRPVLDALGYLHKNGFAHGHIAPSNIMRSRLVVLSLSLYLAFAVIGCTSKPPASSGNDMNNQQSADNAGAGGTTTSPGPAANTAPAAAPAPEAMAPEPVKPAVVPAGTALTVRLGETLSSKTSQDGQSFTGTLVNPVEAGGATVIPAGSSVSGTVVSAKSAGRFKGESLLALRLDTITVKGTQRTIQTSTVSSGQKGKGKRTATMIGGGAGQVH